MTMQIRVRQSPYFRFRQMAAVLCAGLALSGCAQSGSSGTFVPPPAPVQTAPAPAVKPSATQPPPAVVPAPSAAPATPAVPGPAANAATGVTGRGAMAAVGLSAASASLMSSANQHAGAGDLAAAAADIEHALSIEPAQPRLWLELGELRLRQGLRDQARNMARKALTLVGSDAGLSARAADLLRRTSR